MAFWSIIPAGSGIDYTVEARSKEDAFNMLAQRIASTGDVRTMRFDSSQMILAWSRFVAALTTSGPFSPSAMSI